MFPFTPTIASFFISGVSYIQAPETYNTGTASSTTEFFNSFTQADPTAAQNYWTCCVGDPQSSGLHYCEWQLNGEPTAVDSDTRAAMIGFINQLATTPFGTGYFGALANQIGVYCDNGRVYNNGGTGTYLKDPDGSTWTPTDISDKIGIVMRCTGTVIEGYVYRVGGGGGSPGFCRNPDNSIPDPLTGSNPNFTLTGTTGQITIGDAAGSPDLRARIIPHSGRQLQS